MTDQITTINDFAVLLKEAVDEKRVITDPDILEGFSHDTSLCIARKPDIVVKALSTKEVSETPQPFVTDKVTVYAPFAV